MCLTGIKYDVTIQNVLIYFFSYQNIIYLMYLFIWNMTWESSWQVLWGSPN